MDLIEEIFGESPLFHLGETEINRVFSSNESLLSSKEIESLSLRKPACYGISKDVAHFIKDYIGPSSKSLETGAGISTLIFAITGAKHFSITPNGAEAEAIRLYAKRKEINIDRVQFIIESSDKYLPTSDINNIDMVFIDGKHAFPWPVLDWFYTADRLRKGGIMVVDDAKMKSVKILVDFMGVDSGWVLLKAFGNKTIAFRKERESAHDVAWHMQPYNIDNQVELGSTKKSLRRFVEKLKKAISN